MRVGFVGLGAMGRPMALHLLRGGHALAVWSRRPESAQPLVDAGAMRCPTPAALAQWAEVVFSIVTTGADVEQVVFGPQGLAEGFSPGAVFVDMSTIAPASARDIAARLAARGVDMLDAPVSGGEAGAIA
ncbi:MAG: NAD(P)-binding domain-containing protein, partial [Proteobacteria bacterium]|nr:NAD(P)-binding domain-containing protein [Pseudomonadota bacterium]